MDNSLSQGAEHQFVLLFWYVFLFDVRCSTWRVRLAQALLDEASALAFLEQHLIRTGACKAAANNAQVRAPASLDAATPELRPSRSACRASPTVKADFHDVSFAA
eukprot:6204807-Pleurochrysis_carterae.AAC.2